MTTTITGTSVTFTDGSTWGGATGSVVPDTNTDRSSQSYNIGHLILANTIFVPNSDGFSTGGTWVFAMNMTNSMYYTGRFISPFVQAVSPAVNTQATFAAAHPTQGSQSYYAIGPGNLAGSWRARGMACGAGINQTNGYFVLLERVA
jgi:hypothetical protein